MEQALAPWQTAPYRDGFNWGKSGSNTPCENPWGNDRAGELFTQGVDAAKKFDTWQALKRAMTVHTT